VGRSCPAQASGSRTNSIDMKLVLDAGGLSALVHQRARLAELRTRGLWPAEVPSVVLAEALTGDPRRDFHTNRLLKACQIRDVNEHQAREAARLRTATRRAGSISAAGAVDAVVAAVAAEASEAIVLTSDRKDLLALAEHVTSSVVVVRV
jgi:predicted nucleic acid-binding protein